MITKRLKGASIGTVLAAVVLASSAATAASNNSSAIVLARLEPDRAVLVPEERPAGALSERDADLYRRIFALQEKGEWKSADALIGRLRDPILLGHVLFQRYMHPTAWRSTYQELKSWLERYADHPDADHVYRLARRRQPAGAAPLPQPVSGYLAGAGQLVQERVCVCYRPKVERSAADEALVQAWRGQIETLAANGQPREALIALVNPEALRRVDQVEADLVHWTIARAFFATGEDRAALDLAQRAARRSGGVVPEIHWTAGISAWRLGRIELAAQHFAALANAKAAHEAERSRAAFWAARAYLTLRKPDLVGRFLDIAARGSRDFYGLLARAVLGQDATYNWDEIGFEQNGLRVLMSEPGARRAMALGQVGQVERAEREIRKLAGRATPDVIMGLIAISSRLHLPATQMRLAQRLGTADGRYHHGALYPLPSWRPASGFRLDRALIFAIMRAESAFDPDAASHVGALGLMQVMPQTARDIAKRASLTLPASTALLEPETSISFGQAYLEHLLQYSRIGDNLIYLAAAYNAGPGRVFQWQTSLPYADDPLLFLESIPMKEPRIYVKKVLTNLWTYRARLGQPRPSLQALAGNAWPRYQSLDAEPTLHARR